MLQASVTNIPPFSPYRLPPCGHFFALTYNVNQDLRYIMRVAKRKGMPFEKINEKRGKPPNFVENATRGAQRNAPKGMRPARLVKQDANAILQPILGRRIGNGVLGINEANIGNYDWLGGWCQGKEAWIVGGDGTLCGFRFELLKDRPNSVVIAVNNSIREVPFADMLVFLDPGTKQTCGMGDLRKQHFKVLAAHTGCMTPGGNVSVMKAVSGGFVEWPSHGKIFSPKTSAHLGMSAAIWGGASKINLIGISANQFLPELMPRYLSYTSENPWYNVTPELLKRMAFCMEKYGRIQHYYGLTRQQTRAQDKNAFYPMAKSYAQFRAHRDKIVSYSFMSNLMDIPKGEIREVAV